MAKKSRLERIKDTIRKILKGEIKHNSWAERSEEDYSYPCPYCESARLEFSHEVGFDPDTESIYECTSCEKQISSGGVFRINDAYKAMKGEDPYSGEIWVDDENYWSTPPKHDWAKIVDEIKREIEQEGKDEDA